MKSIDKDELYQHLGGFLKTRGIELKDGSYAQAIRTSCGLLTDAINLGQQGVERAKVGIDKKLDQMRQVIHEKTAPPANPASAPAGAASPGASAATEAAAEPTPKPEPKAKTAKRKTVKPAANAAAKRPAGRGAKR